MPPTTNKPYKDADAADSIITAPTSDDDYSDATTVDDCPILALTDDEHLDIENHSKALFDTDLDEDTTPQNPSPPICDMCSPTNDAETLTMVEQQSLHFENFIN
jgi:hypothetical protein